MDMLDAAMALPRNTLQGHHREVRDLLDVRPQRSQ